jgi:7-cyano-7-deazaguanine synthase
MSQEKKGAVILLSGGQDSTTALFWAKLRFDPLYALTVLYGQRHAREVEAAKAVAQLAGVKEHWIAEVPLVGLTASDLLAGGGEIGEKGRGGLPTSFVPGRNILFVTLAASAAYGHGCEDVVVGVSQVDYSGYPDCRLETLLALQSALRLGLAPFDVNVHAPFVMQSKAQEVKLARELPGCWDALAKSWTCYYGGERPCGECPACRLRAQAFAEAEEKDPAL